MHVTSQTTASGVRERRFTVDGITGALWSPAGTEADTATARPLVLLGHGGGQHSHAPGVLARAQRYVTRCGFVAAAIDAPGHGDRPRTTADEQFFADLQRRMAAGEPVGDLLAEDNAARAHQAVPEWQATLDALETLDCVAPGVPVGYWGVSLGTMIGIPLVAAEPRITAAVFGLVGSAHLTGDAARITVPVQFLLQWDDELVPREAGLALFDAFAATEKTLHANTGRHMDLPRFEVASAELFFTRHLTENTKNTGNTEPVTR
ncbi:alpha/beta hydrolase [Frankia sp. CcI49]|uniref:alpha/beta hydrolase n=1 Tax=Frankia sp. CcI49 TaxID=1745382 RepID=UPI000E2F769B